MGKGAEGDKFLARNGVFGDVQGGGLLEDGRKECQHDGDVWIEGGASVGRRMAKRATEDK
jgi:hypothetical protein